MKPSLGRIEAAARAAASAAALAAGLGAAAVAEAEHLDRLPAGELGVLSPAARVSGEPGQMRVIESSCEARTTGNVRRRVVDIAVQEWAFFGFNVVDLTVSRGERRGQRRGFGGRSSGRRFSWLDSDESARVADSIAGYWAITSEGGWILERQNERWAGPGGVASRWRDPWSAAFISWVMCESGLTERSEFRRAIAHYTYIDQAIEARDAGTAEAAFAAYDVGEAAVAPGDLVCAGRRPSYESLDERRRQLGVGIRSHCDIVIKLEPERDRILAIGGNVRGKVSLKYLPAEVVTEASGEVSVTSIGRGRDTIFAHLKLRAEAIEADAFDNSPTLREIGERPEMLDQLRTRLAGQTS